MYITKEVDYGIQSRLEFHDSSVAAISISLLKCLSEFLVLEVENYMAGVVSDV
jgi:hypothetical protein